MSIHYRHLLKPTGQPNLTMTSNQLSSERLKQIEETAERLGVSVDELVGTLLDLSKSVVPQDHQSQEYYEHWTDFTPDIAQYFLESLPVAAVVIDKDGRIVTVNVQAVDVFQYEREELINKPLEILLPEIGIGEFRCSTDIGQTIFCFAKGARPYECDLKFIQVREEFMKFLL
jgi:PAS domain-containing protein